MLIYAFKQLLFNPTCLLCGEPLANPHFRHFCAECNASFDRIEAATFCPACFSETCSCHARPRLTRRVLATFDNEGQAAALLAAFKFSGRSYLADGMGALMTLQWLDQRLPFPDLIVPVPSSPLRNYKRGYSPSLLLAQTIGRLLQRPVWNGLKKELTFLSQSDLSDSERLQLPPNHLLLTKNPAPLRDQHLLLVDDAMKTGQTLHLSASRLLEGYPKCIDALVFARG